jgi:CelD/BcsL family acetyltransferase involved in cellulose biosynthesis
MEISNIKKVDDDLFLEIHRDFPNVRESWDNIVELTNAGIYSTYDWCEAWWSRYKFDRELRIFLIYSSKHSRLVGVLPMIIDAVRIGLQRFRLAKTIGSDFTLSSCEIPIRIEYAEKALNKIVTELITNDCCDAILFGPIISNNHSTLLVNNVKNIKGDTRIIEYESSRPHAIFKLPKSFDEYMMSIGKSTRGNYKNRWNRLGKKYEVVEDIVKEPFSRENVFPAFMKMHAEQWSKMKMPGHFGDWPSASEFHKDLAIRQSKQNRFTMFRLSASGIPINYRYAYAYGNTIYSLLTARMQGGDWDRFALGQLSYIRLIAWAIKEGYTQIDAGPGHYPHKLQFGATEHIRRSILLINNNFISRWRCLNFRIQGKLLDLIYYKIWFSRVAPKLGVRDVLWGSWIRRQFF